MLKLSLEQSKKSSCLLDALLASEISRENALIIIFLAIIDNRNETIGFSAEELELAISLIEEPTDRERFAICWQLEKENKFPPLSEESELWRGYKEYKRLQDHVEEQDAELIELDNILRLYRTLGVPNQRLTMSTFPALKPPSTPEEAILSRRNPYSGFVVLADIRHEENLNTLLLSVRDSIVDIVYPTRSASSHPVKSPCYIKQKAPFHAPVFCPAPLPGKRYYEVIKKSVEFTSQIDNIYAALQRYLNENNPYLEPIQFELMEDGTAIARFSYKNNGDLAALTKLQSELDPDKIFVTWDKVNPNCAETLTVTLATVNTNEAKIKKIQSLLAEKSTDLKAVGHIKVTQFRVITEYDKGGFSEKHIRAELEPVKKIRLG